MIYRVGVRNPKNQIMEMILTNPEKTGINVKKITGISPADSDIYMTPFGTIDGAIYSGSRVPSRNVVLTLGMYPKERSNGRSGTIEDSRLILYNYFRIKDPIDLIFYTDNRDLILSGYVESNDVDIFSDSETATVSVLCVNPWFKTVGYPINGFVGSRGCFTFPFKSKQGGITYPDLLKFGNVSIDTRMTINYKGDITTGFQISITFLGSLFHNIYLYNMDTSERLTLYTDQIEKVTGQALDKGDEIQVSTVSGEKGAYLIRDGYIYNATYMVDKDSSWFQLSKGDNIFAYACDYGVENIDMILTYEDRFAGI